MENEGKRSRGQAVFTFVLLFLLYFFDYADRTVVNSLFPFLKKDWGLTDAECGSLTSIVTFTIAAGTLPISVLIDRWSRTRVIGTMAVIWSLFTAACGFAGSFAQLFAARIGIGLGEAGYAPGGTAMIAGLFSDKRRSLFMGIWNASIQLGAATGVAVGGYVAQHYGWQRAFGLVALPGLVVSLLFFFVKDYKTVKLSENQKHMGMLPIAKKFLATPSLILTYIAFAANNVVTSALLVWLPTFLHRTQGIPMDQAGPKGGAVMLLAIVGAPLGGFLADLWHKKKPNARPVFAGLSALVTTAVFWVAFSLFSHGSSAQYGMILVGGLVAVSYVPAGAALTQDVVHPGLRAVSYSLCVVSMNMLGASVGPLLIGSISDHTDIATALSVLPAFSLVSALFFFAASKYYVRDVNRAQSIENVAT